MKNRVKPLEGQVAEVNFKLQAHLQENLLFSPEEVVREINLEQGIRLCEIGCGIGQFTFPLAKALGENGVVYGLDRCQDLLIESRQHYENLLDTKMASIEFLTFAEDRLPFLPNSLDLVFVTNILSKANNKQKFLMEITRVLKGEARVIIVERINELMGFTQDELNRYLEPSGLTNLFSRQIGQGHYMITAVKKMD